MIGRLNPFTGNIELVIDPHMSIDCHSGGNVPQAQLNHSLLHNALQTDDVIVTLGEIDVPGLSFTVILSTSVAKYFRLDCHANNEFYLDGVAAGPGKYVGMASAVKGSLLSCMSFPDGAGGYNIHASAVSGTWAAEP